MTKDYPSDWDSRRKKVYKRDNYTCQNCGREGRKRGPAELHAHHIVPKSSGGTHQLSNLQTLCSDCHKAIHGDSMAPTGDSQNNEIISEANIIIKTLDSLGGNIDYCPICGEENMGKYRYNPSDLYHLLSICPTCNSIFSHGQEDHNRLVGGDKNFLAQELGKDRLKDIWGRGFTAEAWEIIHQNDYDEIEVDKLKHISDSKAKNGEYATSFAVFIFCSSVLISLLTSMSIFLTPIIGLFLMLGLKSYHSLNKIDPERVLSEPV